jgi:hypothetical protein
MRNPSQILVETENTTLDETPAMNKPINKAAALGYLRKGWVLEFWVGLGFQAHAWVRETPKSTSVFRVHLNAAVALRDSGLLEQDVTDKWRPIWRLKSL